MKWSVKLQEGIFLKRYKRFFADVELNNQVVIAHVANTGSLKGANKAGQPCLITPAKDPSRKLKFTLEAIKADSGCWIGVNTSLSNHLVKEAFENKIIPHWHKFDHIQSEVKINQQTRLDFCLSQTTTGRKHYVEVKNVTFKNHEAAVFPDAVTERGQKHLLELIELVQQGHTAEIFYTVQRSDCRFFKPADDIDPEYGRLLRQAKQVGVLISAYIVDFSLQEIILTNKSLEIRL